MAPRDPDADRHLLEPGISLAAPPPFAPDHPDLAWLFSLNRHGYRPGLRRILGLLADLGHPERGLRTVVVAGTNGKGSTTRLLAELCRAAGRRTAAYTSPHLLGVTERLELDGRPVPLDDLLAAAARVRPLVDRHEASWFETLTALAVLLAREAGMEVLVAEVGLGGRLDATNALPAAAVLLTDVALDHQRILGETVEAIAAEKLGLLKPGVPLVTAVSPELRPQVFAAAVAAEAPCLFLDEAARLEDGPGGWRLVTRRAVHDGLPADLPPVQRRNAALALLALEELSARDPWWRLPADPAAALAGCFLPGRWHRLLVSPDLLLDTAHNDQALRQVLARFLAMPCAGRRVVLFGGMADKTVSPAVGELLARCDRVVGAPISLPRSRNREQLAALFLEQWRLPPERVELAASPAAALATLADRLEPQDALLVCGSCFLVAETLWALGYRELAATRRPQPAAAVLGRLAAAGGGPAAEGQDREGAS